MPNGDFLIPTPQNTATGISSVTQNCSYNADQFVTNADYLINDRNKISGRFFFENGNQNATFPSAFSPTLPGFPQTVDSKFRDFTLTYTRTFNSNLFNQVMVGFNRLNNVLGQGEPTVSSPTGGSNVAFTYGLIGTTAPGLDDTFPGIGVFGQFELGGNGQGVTLIQNQYNLEDTLTWLWGRHTFRFGGGFSRQEINFPKFHFLGASIFANMRICCWERCSSRKISPDRPNARGEHGTAMRSRRMMSS